MPRATRLFCLSEARRAAREAGRIFFEETTMPVHPARLRLAPLAAALVASLLLGGCGGKSAGNSTQAHLSDLKRPMARSMTG